MKAKTIISTALLLFIFASVAYLVVKELRVLAQATPAQTCPPAVLNNNEVCCEDALFTKPPTKSPQKVVVYYFHGDFRCPTCRKFEAYSHEALRTAFFDSLNDGRLEWRVVNVDKPANEHFVSDYQLHTRAVVLVKIQSGKQTEWKNLEKIWGLVGNKAVFVKYIQDEVSMYLGAD